MANVKTVMIALYEAYPPVSGAASVSYHLARHLPGNVTLLQMSHRTTRTEPPAEMALISFPYGFRPPPAEGRIDLSEASGDRKMP